MKFGDYLELTKPRICVMALIMATLGFVLASGGDLDYPLYLLSLLGIGLVGASSCVLNQYLEWDLDRQMNRTQNRPIPSGRLTSDQALRFGVVLGVLGVALLLILVNSVTAVLAAITVLFYLAVYTPAKRINSLSTLVGAIPGAMPPLLGWTAAYGSISREGLILFAILFLWQIPHFLAIGWIYKDDYSKANFPILNVVDEKGESTARQMVTYSLALLPVTLVPTAWGMTGRFYFYGALVLGLSFLALGVLLAFEKSRAGARRLFLASLLYLPLLGMLMAWDRNLP